MYGTPTYRHSNKNGFSKLLTPYIRLAPNTLSWQNIYTSLWWIVNILTSVWYQIHINFSGKGLCNILFPAINLQPQMLVYGITNKKSFVCRRSKDHNCWSAALACAAAYVIFSIYLCHIRENVEFLTRLSHRVRQTKRSGVSLDGSSFTVVVKTVEDENTNYVRIRKITSSVEYESIRIMLKV